MEKRVLKLDDLIKLSMILTENGFADADMNIIINVPSDKLLNKINEDLYFRTKDESKPTLMKNVDEIEIYLNNINFKYIKKNDISKI